MSTQTDFVLEDTVRIKGRCRNFWNKTKENQLNNSLENALLNRVSYCNVQKMCLKNYSLKNF